jgi:hypothetical protein
MTISIIDCKLYIVNFNYNYKDTKKEGNWQIIFIFPKDYI